MGRWRWRSGGLAVTCGRSSRQTVPVFTLPSHSERIIHPDSPLFTLQVNNFDPYSSLENSRFKALKNALFTLFTDFGERLSDEAFPLKGGE